MTTQWLNMAAIEIAESGEVFLDQVICQSNPWYYIERPDAEEYFVHRLPPAPHCSGLVRVDFKGRSMSAGDFFGSIGIFNRENGFELWSVLMEHEAGFGLRQMVDFLQVSLTGKAIMRGVLSLDHHNFFPVLTGQRIRPAIVFARASWIGGAERRFRIGLEHTAAGAVFERGDVLILPGKAVNQNS